jgi:hypothetical protein
VLVSANPVVGSLATFSTDLAPVSNTLNHSVDNLLAVLDNWSRAIQFRDGLSHVFRGEASITTDVVESLVNRMLGSKTMPAHDLTGVRKQTRAASAAPASPAPASAPTGRPQAKTLTSLLGYLLRP